MLSWLTDWLTDWLTNFSSHTLTDEEDAQERLMCYERYKILVANEFEKIHEERFLKSIFMEERHGKVS